jgi:hypothetical protein
VFAATGAGADAPVVTVTQTLAGLNDVAAGGYEPPDVQVAAGGGFVVELVNLAERVWQTGGGTTQLSQTRDLAALFGTGGDRLTDPRILFDAASGRWLASISDIDDDSVALAVSAGGDPTGRWSVSLYRAPGCADQPRLGVSDSVVVLAADIYQGCNDASQSPLGNEIWIVNKAQLLAGSAAPAYQTSPPSAQYASVAPVQSLSSTSTEYAVSVDNRASRVVHLLAIDGVPPDPVTVSEVATPAINVLSRPPLAAQPPIGGRASQAIETNDNRVLDSVWENGRLWWTANGRCLLAGDPLIRSCGRVVELSTTTGTVDWDVDIGEPGAHVFYPAVRPDRDGNLVIVAGESGVSLLPRLVVVGRTPDGALSSTTVVARSAAVYRGERYGDYFGAARDPQQPDVVWVAGEAGSERASGRGWSTNVASVVVTAAGATPPVVAAAAPPGIRAVSTVLRLGAAVQLAYRTVDDGAGIRTVISVRNARNQPVFRRTTAATTVHANERYTVVWPANGARGTFRYCVNTLAQSGLQSPVSCVRITLR